MRGHNAAAAVEAPGRVLSESYVVVADYDRPFPDMLKAGRYDSYDPDVLAVRFEVSRSGRLTVPLYLWPHNNIISSDAAIEDMRHDGFRPADHVEGMALREQHGDISVQGESPIVVVLGSVGLHRGRRVLWWDFAYGGANQCRLGLGWYNYKRHGGWHQRDWFLVAPLES